MVARKALALSTEPVWVRLAFGVGAVVAVVGDALFVRAGPGTGASAEWTAFFGAYLALAAIAAAIAVVGQGSPRAVSAGTASGAAIAFNVLALLSVGVFFVPLTIWLVAAARRVSEASGRTVVLAAGAVALVAPFLGLVLAPP